MTSTGVLSAKLEKIVLSCNGNVKTFAPNQDMTDDDIHDLRQSFFEENNLSLPFKTEVFYSTGAKGFKVIVIESGRGLSVHTELDNNCDMVFFVKDNCEND